ncbi:MAG: metallophosphoesterase family protein [Deltaproteobacteria bacterium]|nr:metallophosphoesterase family protein [Deltaproteobacteria bacterium]
MTRSSVPPTRRLHVEDAVIALAHGHGVARLPHDLVREFAGADAVVFGHTHRALCERRGGVLVLNPGSLLHPRGTSVGSVALLTVRGNRVDGEIIYCDGRERAS